MHRASVFGSCGVLSWTGHRCLARQKQLNVQAGKGFAELLELNRTPKNGKGNKSDQLRAHQVSPMLHVPEHIRRPAYVGTGDTPWGKKPEIHDAEGLVKMRAACKLAAEVLEYAGSFVQPGTTTDFIDKKVHEMIVDNGAYPSPLTYGNFPKSVCTSVNECLCHGIPDGRKLRDGDVVNIDVTVYLNGYHGDTSRMFFAGTPSDRAKWLCDVTEEAMYEGIRQCRPGAPVNAIGKAIQDLAERHRLQVCPDFVGHGVGKMFHGVPTVVPVRNWSREKMQVNQTFTIEPILVDGSPKHSMWQDGWTVTTKDKSWSAQHEHTVLITETGYEILTKLN